MKSDRGLTLIEVMIIVAILGIALAIFIPALQQRQTDRAATQATALSTSPVERPDPGAAPAPTAGSWIAVNCSRGPVCVVEILNGLPAAQAATAKVVATGDGKDTLYTVFYFAPNQ